MLDEAWKDAEEPNRAVTVDADEERFAGFDFAEEDDWLYRLDA